MNHMDNSISSVCLCGNIEKEPTVKIKDEPLESKEVMTKCASVQLQEYDQQHEQICSRCLGSKRCGIKIKSEIDDVYIEDTKILNICNFEDVKVKKEQEETQSESLPISFIHIECNSVCDAVKIESDNVSLEDPLNVDIDNTYYKGRTNLQNEDSCDELKAKLFEEQKELPQSTPCKVCNKQFKNKYRLVQHEKIHYSSFKCDHCSKNFSSQGNLTTHKKIHTGNKSYKCNTCGKGFYSAGDLKRHQEIHVEREKCYYCDVCSKNFYNPRDLKAHQRIHTGDKSYKCNMCFKDFFTLRDLKRHKGVHTR